jgi:hypothetical protein
VPYLVLFAAGMSGLVVMMLLGLAHAPHHQAHAHGRALPIRGHVRAPLARPSATANLTVERVTIVGRGARFLGLLLSPLTWFSWMFGGGAVGTLAFLLHATPPVALASAIAGAVSFQLFVIRPMWNLVFRFESQPAGNLESCLMQQVEVIRAFNARGEGLVRVIVDGRSEDLLAILTKSERAKEIRPRRGDRLRIEEIDPRTNTCFVSRD